MDRKLSLDQDSQNRDDDPDDQSAKGFIGTQQSLAVVIFIKIYRIIKSFQPWRVSGENWKHVRQSSGQEKPKCKKNTIPNGHLTKIFFTLFTPGANLDKNGGKPFSNRAVFSNSTKFSRFGVLLISLKAVPNPLTEWASLLDARVSGCWAKNSATFGAS